MGKDWLNRDLRIARFAMRRLYPKRWEENSEYKWEVYDRDNEVKPILCVLKVDAERTIARLRKQHKASVKAARTGKDRTVAEL